MRRDDPARDRRAVAIDLRLSKPALLALAALTALAAWTALSALWSPAPDIALVDGERVLLYALLFGLGIWLCNLLGPRMELSLAPVVAGAAFAGVATIIALLGPDPRDLLESDGTLDFPLGYRNANVAFFAIAFFPAVGLAASPKVDWRARASRSPWRPCALTCSSSGRAEHRFRRSRWRRSSS